MTEVHRREPLPTEQSLGVLGLRQALDRFLDLVKENTLAPSDERLAIPDECLPELSRATQFLGDSLQHFGRRIDPCAASDLDAQALVKEPLLRVAIRETCELLVSHDPSDGDYDKVGEGHHWIAGEGVSLRLLSTLRVARKILMDAVKRVIQPDSVSKDETDPIRRLDDSLSDIQVFARRIDPLQTKLEALVTAGEITRQQAVMCITYASPKDDAQVQLHMQVDLDDLEHDQVEVWRQEQAKIGRSVVRVLHAIDKAKRDLELVAPFTDRSEQLLIDRWTTKLNGTLDSIGHALKKGQGQTFPAVIIPALGTGVGDALRLAIEPLVEFRSDLRAMMRPKPHHPPSVTVRALSSVGAKPPIPRITPTQLEQKIDDVHRKTGMPIAEAAMHICLVDLPDIYTGIPVWTALNEDRKSKAATMTSMVNAMAQAKAASGQFGPPLSLHEMKELNAHVGIPAMPDAITIAQNGAMLIERAQRAVQQGAVGSMDLTLNPGAHTCRIEIATRLDSAASTFAKLVLCLQSDTLRMDEVLQCCSGDRTWFAEVHNKFMAALAVPVKAVVSTVEGPLNEVNPKFEFRQNGKVWEVAFEGTRGRLLNYVGMQYIAFILSHPNPRKAIEATELSSRPREQSTDIGGVVRDGRGMDAMREALEQLKKEREEADENGDAAALARIDKEVEVVAADFQATTGKDGRSRLLAKRRSPEKAAREQVWEAIKRVCDALNDSKPSLDALTKHLKATVKREGTGFAYRPGTQPPDWKL